MYAVADEYVSAITTHSWCLPSPLIAGGHVKAVDTGTTTGEDHALAAVLQRATLTVNMHRAHGHKNAVVVPAICNKRRATPISNTGKSDSTRTRFISLSEPEIVDYWT
jgi:hypothetical protein